MRFFRTAPGILLIVFVLFFANDYFPYLLTPIFFLDRFIFGSMPFDMLMQYQKEFFYYSRDFFYTIELMVLFTTIFCAILYRLYETKQEKKGCSFFILSGFLLLYGFIPMSFSSYNSYHDFFNLVREIPYVRNHDLTVRHIDHATFFNKNESHYWIPVDYTCINVNEEESLKLYPQAFKNHDDVVPFENQRIDIFYLPYTKRVLFLKKCDFDVH